MIIKDIKFFGCSYTDPMSGWVDADKMYPAIVSRYYNCNEVNYAKKGGSNYRSFDLISTINIDSDSVIVLQLTELARIRWHDTVLKDIMLSNTTNRCLVSVFNDEYLIHELKRHLRLLVSLCRSKQAKLVIWSIARFYNEKLNQELESFLSSFSEYIYLDNSLESKDSYRVDDGLDSTGILGTGHPGPKSHQIIAQKLIDKINSLYPNIVDK